MTDKKRRGPKRGKRVTSKILAEIVLESIQSRKSLSDIIEERNSEGFNIKKNIEEILLEIGVQEISFMLANVQLIKSIREETVENFINEIQNK